MYQILWPVWVLLQLTYLVIIDARHLPGRLAERVAGHIPLPKPIQCYDCVGCYTVDSEPTIVDCPSACCYTVLWTESEETILTRACADLNNTYTCSNYCNRIKAIVRHDDPDGVVHQCETCTTSTCNNLRVFQEFEMTTNYEPVTVECYECKNCTQLVLGAVKRVQCLSECCYSAVFKERDGKISTIRECARVSPGRSCFNNCDYIKSDNSNKDVKYCKTCSVDNCNSESLVQYNE